MKYLQLAVGINLLALEAKVDGRSNTTIGVFVIFLASKYITT